MTPDTDGIWLPFTYPPFAALMFLPFVTVPSQSRVW